MTLGPTEKLSPIPSSVLAHYERLRMAALGEALPPEARSGLMLFLRRGMWAWAQAQASPKTREVTSRLSGPLADLFELGRLVGRGLIGQADETDTMAIWTIAKQLGCEEWVSGRPAGSPTGQRESIHRLVLNRLPEIDQLFSTRPLPEMPGVAIEGKEVVIPPSVSDAIASQVASRVDPRLQQIREDIADYAVMGAVDREKPVAATEPLLTMPKAMKQAGLSRRRLMELIADGKVSTKQVGQRQMVIPESLRAYLSTPDCQRQGDPIQASPPTVSSRKHSIPDYLDG